MDDNAKTYYEDMVKRGEEYIAEIKAMATTIELEDEATGIKYRMGLSGGTIAGCAHNSHGLLPVSHQARSVK